MEMDRTDVEGMGILEVIPTSTCEYEQAIKETSKCHLFYVQASD